MKSVAILTLYLSLSMLFVQQIGKNTKVREIRVDKVKSIRSQFSYVNSVFVI